MEEIAELLRTTREESGIELSEVSRDLGIDEYSLLNIENGKIGSFKDIFILKENISNYAKYLGLDADDILDDFNEYLFSYTSKIPIKDIEKNIESQEKGESLEEKVTSPYTIVKLKSKRNIYILVYILIFILVILAIFWSINQITVDKKNAYVISYRK